MVTNREEWVKLTHEDPLEPGLPICDPHHHLWDYPDELSEDRVPGFARHIRHYVLKQILEDAKGHNVVQTVFMECGSMFRDSGPEELRPVGETEFVQGIAAQSASGKYGNARIAAGIVGAADLTLGSRVEPALEAQIAASPNRFRGIRYISTWHADKNIASRAKIPGLLADAKFREGFACLHKYNLSFDTWLYHTQIGELKDLAQSFPETTIILDHIGGPLGIGPYTGKRQEVFRDWQQAISDLSKCPNVFIKLGGIGMPMYGFGWHERSKPPDSIELAKAMAPYYLWCIERFGSGRCMFESNFPVDKWSYSYTVVWNAFKRITKDFSDDEKASLFLNTAAKVYRLPRV